jgi:hypothetical protein
VVCYAEFKYKLIQITSDYYFLEFNAAVSAERVMLDRTGWEECNKLRVVIDFNGGCEGIKLLFQHSSPNHEERYRTLHAVQSVELPRYKQLICKLQNTT